ncbi:hypothetical protein EH165_01595 [Nakamurella antarctica]|uniref:Galactose mutarotase n=1 Tax=Nakamurella antarctica TaxID=1902245 RepID=A0A3G8ZIA9_9ACTN|nr:hypothetical protein [Nakamurella antarctica]AZI57053.1 hypothetical protein EH165_01595 [Nakamurella antarctica]
MTVEVVGGGGLTATFGPDRGAKITSLASAGYEWLAQADPDQILGPAPSFVEAEMAGWDECAPSILECTVDGTLIPDHGDLWDATFSCSGATVVAVGHSLQYRFERSMTATEKGLRLDYAVSASKVLPFLWAAHPQFAAPPGTKVAVPGATRLFDVTGGVEDACEAREELWTIDSLPPRATRKVYVDPRDTVTSASLIVGGQALTLRWDATVPYLGVWFDNCTISREPVIAIEPCLGYFDSLAVAIGKGRAAIVSPDKPLRWSIDIEASALT